MKKILILTAFVLSGLAAAQDTTTPVVTPPPADTTPAADTTPTDPAVDPTTPADDTTPADTTTPTDDANPVAPAETAPTDVTPTDTATTAASAPVTLSAADHYGRAQELATQADVAYPAAFYDRTLWKAAVDQAYLATQTGNDRAYNAYLAQLYTKTQWWINAYNAWVKLGTLNDTEKQWAAQSAAKLANMALQRGDKATARSYVTQGLQWANIPSLQDIAKRL